MSKNNSKSPEALNKDTYFEAQKQAVYLEFTKRPATMLEVSIRTGIQRSNICRYVAQFKKEGRITLTGSGICTISKHRAGFYSTHPPKNNSHGRF